jgi:hypothetical protein
MPADNNKDDSALEVSAFFLFMGPFGLMVLILKGTI